MIRPFTCLCILMAAGSGLYLYQTKHRSQLLDRDIVKIINDTQQARERTSILKAEYALLNQPDRLQALADKFLNLKPTQPQQFVQLSDLDSRLPPPRTETVTAMDDDDSTPAGAVAGPSPATGLSILSQAAVSQAGVPQAASVPVGVLAATPAVTPPSPPLVRVEPHATAPYAAVQAAAAASTRAAARQAEKTASEKALSEKALSEKAPSERTGNERAERLAERQPVERPAAEASRRTASQDVLRPVLHNNPVSPVSAPVYQTVAPMGRSSSALAAVGPYTPYNVPTVTSALGAFRTPLAAPVPVSGEQR